MSVTSHATISPASFPEAWLAGTFFRFDRETILENGACIILDAAFQNYMDTQTEKGIQSSDMCAPEVHRVRCILHPACTANYSPGMPFRKLSYFEFGYSSVF